MGKRLPMFTICGSCPVELGTSHGEQLAGRIHATADFYLALFGRLGMSHVQLQSAAFVFERALRNFASGAYAEEIDAIARGAAIEPWKLYVLNARTEIVNSAANAARHDLAECTSLCVPAHALLAQNWDWAQEMEPLLVLMQIRRTDAMAERRPDILMIAEPGIIGKIGINSRGVGVCLNLLNKAGYGKSPVPSTSGPWPTNGLGGVPVHALLRVILDSSSLSSAVAAVRDAPRGWASMSLLFAAEPGQAAAIELDGAREDVILTSTPLLRTNHYLACGLADEPTGSSSSLVRYSRGCDLLKALQQDDVVEPLAGVKALLADTAGTSDGADASATMLPIRRPFVYDPELDINAGTVTTVVMDLAKGEMHLTRGNPFDNAFEIFRVA